MKPIVQIGKAYFVELESTSMQMWLDVYELPEREPRRIVMTRTELAASVIKARESVLQLEGTLAQIKFYVENEFTQDDVEKVTMGNKYVKDIRRTDKPYNGDEDFKFHYNSLSDIYDFIYEATEALYEEG
jgi:hypothetical protein